MLNILCLSRFIKPAIPSPWGGPLYGSFPKYANCVLVAASQLARGLSYRLCCVGLVLQRLRLFRLRGCSRGGIFLCLGVLRVASALVISIHVFQWIAGSSPDGGT